MKARLVGIVLAAAFVALVGFRISKAKQQKAAVVEKKIEAQRIQTVNVARADLGEKIAITGSIRARNEVDVFAKMGGRIEQLAVQVGDKVHQGEALAVVEHKELGWQAKATEAQLKAAQAGLLVAQAGLEAARLDFDRTKQLHEGGSAPQAQLDGARVKLQLSEAQVAQAQAQIAQVEASLGLANQNLANSRIESPISGTVTKKQVNQGSQVGPAQPAFTVQDVATLKLESSVDPLSYSRLARGKPAVIAVDAFPGVEFKGKVDVLSPTLDAASRRASIEILVDNANGKLLPYMFARAELVVGQLPQALAVPRGAVLEGPGGAVVFRVKDGHVEAVHPRLGPTDGNLVAVLEGLNEGDKVAFSGLGNLSDGAAVTVDPAVAQNEQPTLPRQQ